ncbi:MAG: preprotein translocase subunit YajC [Rikenellaceae bacterium]|nr:preprotein translocase subunit YajC [Rikenellaceae bacterium]
MTQLTIFLQAAQAQGGGGMTMIIMMVAIFGIMWLFMIRPQQKKQKEMVKFRQSLQSGDKVITAGGIYGTIREIKDTYVLLEVDKGTDIRVDKSMIMKNLSGVQK